MQSRANKDLYDMISALAGTADFTTSEKAWLLSLSNRRLHEAHRKTDLWQRYIVSAEPRTMTNQIIPFTQDGYYIFGAGSDDVSGLYLINGTQNSVAAYTFYDTDGTTALTSLIYTGTATTWHLISGTPSGGGAILYISTDASNSITGTTSATVAETGWTVSTGTANAPVVRDLQEIEEFIRIHRSQPFLNMSAAEYDYSVQSDGAHAYNINDTTDKLVWVTYKKTLTRLTTLDTDGVLASTEVPSEFFQYLAHAVYADFLRLDGQTSKAVIEENFAKELLDDEMDAASRVSNNNTVLQKFSTHVSRQSR
tara:strand:+ start:915 stop:1844 length:930 start_codon:yes stop_codon:yes gene_type:complete